MLNRKLLDKGICLVFVNGHHVLNWLPTNIFHYTTTAQTGLRHLIVDVPTLHTHTHTHTVRTPLNQWSARRRGHHLQKTQQTQQTNIHSLSDDIRTRNPSNQAAAAVRFRPHGHRNNERITLGKTIWIQTKESTLLYVSSLQGRLQKEQWSLV